MYLQKIRVRGRFLVPSMFCSKSMSHRPSVAFLVRLADGENDVSGEENGGIGDDIGVGDAHVEGRGAI